MRSAIRVAIISAGVISCGFGLIIVTSWLYLRSPAGSALLLSEIKSTLAKRGMQLTYLEGSVLPFSRVYFRNLRITRNSPTTPVEINIRSIELAYSISFLKRHIEFTQVELEDPFITLRAQASPSDQATQSSTESSSLEALQSGIEHPWVSFTLKNFTLRGLHLDVEYQNGPTTSQMRVDKLNLVGTFELSKGVCSSSGDLRLGPTPAGAEKLAASSFSISTGDGGARTELRSDVSGSAKWAGVIRSEAGLWSFDVQPTAVQIALRDLFITQTTKATSLKARLERASLSAQGHLLARQGHVESFELNNELKLSVLSAEQSRQSVVNRFRFGTQRISVEGKGAQNIQLEVSAVTDDIGYDDWFQTPGKLELKVEGRLSRDLTDLKAQTAARLNGIEFLAADLTGKIERRTALQADAKFTGDSRIAAILKPAAALRQFRELMGNFAVKAELDQNHSASKFEFTSVFGGQEFHNASVLAKDFKLTLEGSRDFSKPLFQGKFNLQLPMLRNPSLKAPLQLDVEGDLTWNPGSNEIAVNDLLKVRSPELGKWKAETQLGLSATPWKGQGQSKLTQEEPGSLGNAVFSVDSPMILTHQVEIKDRKADLELRLTAPSLDLSKLGRALDTQILFSLHSPDFPTNRDLDFTLDLKQRQLKLANGLSRLAPTLNGLNLNLSASLQDGERFTLRKFLADFNSSMIRMTAEGAGKISQKDFQSRGLLVAQVPVGFPEVAGHRIQGRVLFPWTLSVAKGRNIGFEGNLQLLDLNWSRGLQRVSGVSGNIPVTEKLIWDGSKIKFASLIKQNPFERVDYDRLRPLINAATQVQVKKIGLEEKDYGPFVGYFSATQNLIVAHQFDLGLGTSGRAYGELYFDVYPANLQMGLLTRLTAIDLAEVLPARYLLQAPPGGKKLSARSGLVVNLNKGSVDGRVDITEIGGAQLITLINMLDPGYENERMNKARTALGFGFPTFVDMVFQSGFLDLGMDLSVAGLGTHLDVRGIPITSQLSSATAGIIKKSEESLQK